MPAKFVATMLSLGVVLTSGCGGDAEPVVVPPEVAAQVKTEPGPEKNKAGKPNMTKLRSD